MHEIVSWSQGSKCTYFVKVNVFFLSCRLSHFNDDETRYLPILGLFLQDYSVIEKTEANSWHGVNKTCLSQTTFDMTAWQGDTVCLMHAWPTVYSCCHITVHAEWWACTELHWTSEKFLFLFNTKCIASSNIWNCGKVLHRAKSIAGYSISSRLVTRVRPHLLTFVVGFFSGLTFSWEPDLARSRLNLLFRSLSFNLWGKWGFNYTFPGGKEYRE